MDRAQRRRQWELRNIYENGWDLLDAWAQCDAAPGDCCIEQELLRLETDPGSLLAALALGQPALIGIRGRWAL
jgi:hypothetical protein